MPRLAALDAELTPQRLMQPRFHIGRKLHEFGITENVHGQFCLIHHHFAVMAVVEMPLEILLRRENKLAIEVVRNFADDVFAVQLVPACRK